tara:strand:+ start:82 stop:462 length:381 start_codon:yes stop_codon:yes gene_type:complete
MPSTIINFSHKINTSVQTGDIAYCLDSDPANVGGFGTAGESNIQLIGDITNIDRILNTITCNLPNGTPTGLDPLNNTEPYIFFGKNESVNTSGVKGYYANAKFVNNNYVESAELFAVSSEVKESSK